MRIALVLGSSTGGVGRHVRMIEEGLTKRGDDVVVLGPAETREMFGFEEFRPVDIATRPHPIRDFRAVLRLRAALKGAQAVHAHGLRAGALCVLALAGRRGRLVVTLHNAPTTGGVTGAVFGALEYVVARGADRVLVVSPDLGVRMRAKGARRVTPALVPAPFLPPATRAPAEVRAEIGVEDRLLWLAVGRLAPQKDMATLLDAAAGVEGALIAIAGDGPLRAGLQERIDREGLPVRLLGHRTDVQDLLAAADGVVSTALWEGQPLSIREALRAGKPMVVTAVGGVPDMVGDAALLVPAEDPAAVRRGLAELTDPALRERLGEAAGRRSRELPDEAAAVGAVAEIYATLG